MGFFDFLKPKKQEVEQPKMVVNSIPTITLSSKEAKALAECYEVAYKRDMANVSGFTPEEVAAIYKELSEVEGGLMNMSSQPKIYEKYFKGRQWSWAEYDKWNKRLEELGRYPCRFVPNLGVVDKEGIVDLLKVADLKEILVANNVEFSSKAKKPDLVALVKTLPNVFDLDIVKSAYAAALEKQKHELFTILLRTICFRGKSLYDHNRAIAVGVKKFELVYMDKSDKEFVDMALKDNPEAIRPFFPYDLTWKESIFDF